MISYVEHVLFYVLKSDKTGKYLLCLFFDAKTPSGFFDETYHP